MHPLAQRLRDDHRHLTQVLDFLASRVEALARADAVDLDLMRDAMTYITEFPNRLHHPLEDVLFTRLAAVDAGAAAACHEQIAEHERLFHDSSAFYGLIEAVQVDDATLPRSALVAQGREFIAAQRAHLLREDAELLPLAERQLDAAAWDSAARTAAKADDPLDATTRPARYERLYRALLQASA